MRRTHRRSALNAAIPAGCRGLLSAALLLSGCRGPDTGQAAAPARADASGAAASSIAAPPLSGRKAGGGSFSLAQLRGAPVVLVFYRGTYCGICTERLRVLARNYEQYDAAGAHVVAVTLDPPDVARQAAKELDAKFETVSAEPDVFKQWGIWKAGEAGPRAAEFVLDSNGRVRFGHVGQTTADMISDVELLGVVREIQSAGQQAAR